MGSFTFIHILLPIIGLALSPGCQSVKITEVINGNSDGPSGLIVFSDYDWELGPNQIVPIYLQTHDQDHAFAFIAHVPSETNAEVVKATIFSRDDNQKTCWEDFSNPYGGTPIFKKLSYVNRNTLEVEYTTAALRFGGGGWGTDIDTSKCVTPEILKSQPAVKPLLSPADWNSTHRFLNTSYSTEDILEPAEVNSTAGFVFTRENNETDPSTSIMFANPATGETTVLDVIQHAPNKQGRRTYAHGKNGYCLMDDIDIVCSQKAWNGEILMNYTHIELPKKLDWLGVHNLKTKAMLVVTTDCPNGYCKELKVRKLEEGNKVNKEEHSRGFRIYCKNPMYNLKMHTTDVSDYSRICFNFVCTDNDYYGRRVFQYRRYCFDKNYFESK